MTIRRAARASTGLPVRSNHYLTGVSERSSADRAGGEVTAVPTGNHALVLGVGGFLGSHVAAHLVRSGWQVTGLARDPAAPSMVTRLAGVLGDLRLVAGDARDGRLLGSLVRAVDVVFDLTGPASSAAMPLRKPRETSPVGVLLRAMRSAGNCPRAVFAGSRLQYGRTPHPPVAESHPLAPVDWYGAAKTREEQAVRSQARRYGLDTCWLRISVAYGPLQALTGRPFGIVGQFLDTATRGQPIQLYGDGRQRRDFVHVNDVGRLFEAVATRDRARGEAFNVGGPEPVSVATVAALASEVTGGPTPECVPWPADRARVETGDYWADLSKARDLLGWVPQIGIRTGIERTWRAECSIGRRPAGVVEPTLRANHHPQVGGV